MEQLGNGLQTTVSRKGFYHDYVRMEQLVREYEKSIAEEQLNYFLPPQLSLPATPVEDLHLYAQQLELSEILERAAHYEEAMHLLRHSSLSNTAWNIENWQPYMIETAISIAQKWRKKSA